jgi:LCP family protein required for cell wall assembly
VAFGFLIAALRLGWEWKSAIDDVDSMIVEPRTLPTQMPNAATVAALDETDTNSQGLAVAPLPTPLPTAIPEAEDPVNILLLGTDARPGEDVSRTDAIILVHLNPRENRVSMLSFPRDLWVDIPGYGHNKINAAYAIGEQRIGRGYGPALIKETVGNLVGVPVHHFVLVNFDGFEKVIDTIGGITIDVPKAIEDPLYPVSEYAGDNRTMHVSFAAGPQFMDGREALIYARTRHADSDFGRNQRQQQVLMAIFDQVREQGLLSQLTRLDDYTNALRDYIRTDIPRGEMLRLARVGTRLDANNIQRYAIDSKMIIVLDDPNRFAADPIAVRQIVDQMTAGGAPPTP